MPLSTHPPRSLLSPLCSCLFLPPNRLSCGGDPAVGCGSFYLWSACWERAETESGVETNSESCGSHSNASCLRSRQGSGTQSWIYAFITESGLQEEFHAKALNFFTTLQIYRLFPLGLKFPMLNLCSEVISCTRFQEKSKKIKKKYMSEKVEMKSGLISGWRKGREQRLSLACPLLCPAAAPPLPADSARAQLHRFCATLTLREGPGDVPQPVWLTRHQSFYEGLELLRACQEDPGLAPCRCCWRCLPC